MELFTKTRKEMFESEIPISTAELPIPRFDDMQTGGHDVNIVLMIKEHAPRRIDQINDEVTTLQERMKKLEAERELLHKLYDVVKEA